MRVSHMVIGTAAVVVLLVVWLWGDSVGFERGRLGSAPAPGASTAATPPPTPPAAGTAKEELPNLARPLLQGRMSRHGEDARELLHAGVTLDYPRAAQLAARIAAEPQLAKPKGGEGDTLNDAVPEGFFTLQAALVKAAESAASAAHVKDGEALGKSFGVLTQTCIECHARYGGGRRTPATP